MSNLAGIRGLALVTAICASIAMGCADGSTPDGFDPNGPNGDVTQAAPGKSIRWLGSLAAAPASPALNDGYYNTTDKKSYIFDGGSWQVIAQDGQNFITWRGSLAAAPGSPVLNDAYYNTTDQKSYLYDGATWQQMAQDGTGVNWQGSFAAAPGSPSANLAYYNTSDGTFYIYDGSAWQVMGYGINWRGQLATAPGSCSAGDFYYNTTDLRSYTCNGGAWDFFASTIKWQGSLASAPASPELNWAYHNTTDSVSYIWDGDSWETLAKVDSKNIEGTLAPGASLTLSHNLNRSDLTFNAQYLKGGTLFDHDDYSGGYVVKTAHTIFHAADDAEFATPAVLTNGNIVIAYRDTQAGQVGYGKFVIYNNIGTTELVAEQTFNAADTRNISLVALGSNNFAIVYTDLTDSEHGSFQIYNYNGSLSSVRSETDFTTQPTWWTNSTNNVDAAKLNNGNLVITWVEEGGSNPLDGKFSIYPASCSDAACTPLVDHTVYAAHNLWLPRVGTLQNNNFVLSYGDSSDGGDGKFMVYNEAGDTVIKAETRFTGTGAIIDQFANHVLPLSSGEFMLGFTDDGDLESINLSTFGSDYNNYQLVSPPIVYSSLGHDHSSLLARDFGMAELTDGSVVVALMDERTSRRGLFFVQTPHGQLKDFGSFTEFSDDLMINPANWKTLDVAALSDRRFIITYNHSNASGGAKGKFVIMGEAFLKIEHVSNNEVKLWNHTTESLSVKLSLDQ